jgi:hypothetical protein
MLAYPCKYCKRFTVLGYVNKYDEHFCTEACYQKYCNDHNYNYNPEDIWEIDNPPKNIGV